MKRHVQNRFYRHRDMNVKQRQNARWKSEPDLNSSADHRSHHRGWFRRHIHSILHHKPNVNISVETMEPFSPVRSLAVAIRCASSPIIPSVASCSPPTSPPFFLLDQRKHKLVVPKLQVTRPSETPKRSLVSRYHLHNAEKQHLETCQSNDCSK